MMKKAMWIISSLFLTGMILASCNSQPRTTETKADEKMEAAREAHARDAHGEGEGEEEGTPLGLDEVYDVSKKGTHLVLAYDAEAKAFKGTVKNISEEVLRRVRVEVHLSNGLELGPTIQADLAPGELREVELTVESDDFTSWSTHAEVGESEHSHEGEGEHGHSHEGEGEHGHSHEGGDHEHN